PAAVFLGARGQGQVLFTPLARPAGATPARPVVPEDRAPNYANGQQGHDLSLHENLPLQRIHSSISFVRCVSFSAPTAPHKGKGKGVDQGGGAPSPATGGKAPCSARTLPDRPLSFFFTASASGAFTLGNLD